MALTAAADLFRKTRAKATGVWKLGLDPHRILFLDNGDIVFAQSSWPQDRLTSLLVEKGLLTQAQLDYALANLKPGISVGKNLIEMGFITQRVLLDIARLQVERVVWGALGTPDEEAAFEARELDANVVRLPFETPLLLLSGLLSVQDREQILEWLGPLNQVVVGEGRKLHELTLPADLAKLPPLLDGTRTLLELARESGVEPLRFGAFALFLRELGWAKLHELPPLDRAAVDLALTPDPQTPSAPLPEPTTADLPPSLFASIEAAGKPTTNLEHLSEALDALPEAEPLQELEELDPLPLEDEDPPMPIQAEASAPDPEPIFAEEGQAALPTPQELPPLPEDTPLPVEPRIHLPLSPETPELPPPFAEEPSEPRSRVRPALLLGLAVTFGAGLWVVFKGRQARPANPSPAPAPVVTPAPAPLPEKPAPAAEAKPEPKPEPKVEPKVELPPPAPAAPAPAVPAADNLGLRLDAIRKGDLPAALKASEGIVAREGASWSLRLLIACQTDTLQNIPGMFQGETPNLFVAPLTMRDGRTCTQIFLGTYANQKAAEAAADKLPAAFQGKGNRPRPFLIRDIQRKQ